MQSKIMHTIQYDTIRYESYKMVGEFNMHSQVGKNDKSSGLLISPLPDMWEGGLWAIALFVCLSACLAPTSTLNLHSADGDTVALCSNLLLRTGGCRFDPSGRQVVLYRVIGMNIFVAFFVLLLLLADVTPPAASSIPLIGLYNSLSQWHYNTFLFTAR